jgi:hypothetical protein
MVRFGSGLRSGKRVYILFEPGIGELNIMAVMSRADVVFESVEAISLGCEQYGLLNKNRVKGCLQVIKEHHQ